MIKLTSNINALLAEQKYSAWRNLTIIWTGTLDECRARIEAELNSPDFKRGSTHQVMVTDELSQILFHVDKKDYLKNSIFTIREEPSTE